MARKDAKAERAFLKRLRAGDEDAHREFFDEHFDMATAVASGVIREYNEAMDVVQEAFIKAFRSIATFKARSSLSTWFKRIVGNTALDHLRVRRSNREIEAGEGLEMMVGTGQTRRGQSPADEATHHELEGLLKEAFEQLPEPQRLALTLFVYGALSYAEIAEELQIPVGTVMSRLFYARKALHEALIGTGYVEDAEDQS